MSPVFTPWNYDLYGWNGTHAVRIFPEIEFGYRTNFSLYENGVIEVFYSSSAAESGTDLYKISDDGVNAVRIDSFTSTARLEEKLRYLLICRMERRSLKRISCQDPGV